MLKGVANWGGGGSKVKSIVTKYFCDIFTSFKPQNTDKLQRVEAKFDNGEHQRQDANRSSRIKKEVTQAFSQMQPTIDTTFYTPYDLGPRSLMMVKF